MLKIRVRQFAHPRAHARRPAPRTVHQVTNVRVLEDDGREVHVGSTLVMVEYRQEAQRIWGALVEHRLRRTANRLPIPPKPVDLANAGSEPHGTLALC